MPGFEIILTTTLIALMTGARYLHPHKIRRRAKEKHVYVSGKKIQEWKKKKENEKIEGKIIAVIQNFGKLDNTLEIDICGFHNHEKAVRMVFSLALRDYVFFNDINESVLPYIEENTDAVKKKYDKLRKFFEDAGKNSDMIIDTTWAEADKLDEEIGVFDHIYKKYRNQLRQLLDE